MTTDVEAAPEPPERRRFLQRPRQCVGLFLLFLIAVASILFQRFHLADLHHHHHWDDPPVTLHSGETLLSRLHAARRDNVKAEDYDDDDDESKNDYTLPVFQFGDSQIPGLVALGTPVEAAEALVCRDSVINYVINATDGKDECEGLTKAFEKTCSHKRRRRLQRRTLKEKLAPRGTLRSWAYEVSLAWKARLKNWLRTSPKSSLSFFAEDAVAGEAYEDARFVVENDMDDDVYRDLRDWMEQRARRLQEGEANVTKPAVKPMSLGLPTGGTKASGATLDIIHSRADSIATLNETVDETAKTAAASTTSKKKEEPPYDPNSPEARICCVSILNVYQENCSSEPEDDVSDSRLFFVVFVMALCGVVKSLIRHFRILWLPEAAGCILVGGETNPIAAVAFVTYFLDFFQFTNMI